MHRVIITDFIHDDLLPERTALSGIATVEALNAHDEDAFVERHDRQIEKRVTAEGLQADRALWRGI